MAARKVGAMCVITIGYTEYLLPADDGMKVVKLMTSAVQVRSHYDDGRAYELQPDEEVNVEWTAVLPKQVRPRPRRQREVAAPLALEGHATRLLTKD